MGIVISGFSFIISIIFTEFFCEPLKASKIRLIFLEYHLQYRLEYHQSDEKYIRTTILHNIFRAPDLQSPLQSYLQSAFLDFRKNLKKTRIIFDFLYILYRFCRIFIADSKLNSPSLQIILRRAQTIYRASRTRAPCASLPQAHRQKTGRVILPPVRKRNACPGTRTQADPRQSPQGHLVPGTESHPARLRNLLRRHHVQGEGMRHHLGTALPYLLHPEKQGNEIQGPYRNVAVPLRRIHPVREPGL